MEGPTNETFRGGGGRRSNSPPGMTIRLQTESCITAASYKHRDNGRDEDMEETNNDRGQNIPQ